jgi:hypothetical protein
LNINPSFIIHLGEKGCPRLLFKNQDIKKPDESHCTQNVGLKYLPVKKKYIIFKEFSIIRRKNESA